MSNQTEENTTTTAITIAPLQHQTKCSGSDKQINNNLEKTINLNEFLDFLNISCHVNDMISQNNNNLQQQQLQSTAIGIGQKSEQTAPTLAKFSVQQQQTQSQLPPQTHLLRPKQQRATTSIDFRHLTQNSLLRKFYGFGKTDVKSSTETAENDAQHIARCSGDSHSIPYPWYPKRQRSFSWCTIKKPTADITETADTMSVNTLKGKGELREKLSHKLDELLKEGVLDSVIPFICPVPLPTNYANKLKSKKQMQTQPPPPQQQQQQLPQSDKPVECVEKLSATNVVATDSGGDGLQSTIQQNDDKIDSATTSVTINKASRAKQTQCRRKLKNTPSEQSTQSTVPVKKSNDIVIHVCDEVKNTTKDFICPQDLLIGKMGYFADVSKKQKLDEMDISVHCDIKIFEWLMKWLKFNAENDIKPNAEKAPTLGYNNVIPILVSATFLKMEPLILECLSFCHSHLTEVVRYSPNLSCLNDTIINRMAATFTNVELEMVEDKRDRLTPRLWTKLIQSLCEIEPETLRGHFSTVAGLFKCSRCHQYVTNTMKTYIMCVPSNMRLNRWGQVVNHHTRDPNWDLNLYITQLFKEMNSWRLVYWKLWGHVHYLYCCLCETHFPVYQMNWCRFHPDTATYLGPMIDGRTTGPAGRYACCGQQVFRYETLPTPNGCRFRDHSVLVETDQERSILSICQLAIDDTALGETPLWILQEATVKNEYDSQWSCLSLLPKRGRQGLLPVIDGSEDMVTRLLERSKWFEPKYYCDSTTETDTSVDSMDSKKRKLRKKSSRKNNLHRSVSVSSTCSSDGGCRGGGSSSGGGGTGESSTFLKKKKRNFWNYHKKQIKKQKNSENYGRQWAGDLSARSNQDHQREYEERVMKQILDVAHKKSASDIRSRRGLNKISVGGTYVRLEQEWRDQIKHRSSMNLSTNSSSCSLGICGTGNGGACTSSSTSIHSKFRM